MKNVKKWIKWIVVVYLAASILISVAYNVGENAWEIATHRNGLLCVGIGRFIDGGAGVWVLSPFCNYGDVFLFVVGVDEEGWYMFSDGLY